MKIHIKLIICVLFMFVTFQSFSQFVIINITWINTDKSLLGVLGQKLAINAAITAEQAIIHKALDDIRYSKIATRIKEYEKNKYDGSLKIPLAFNLTVNTILIGAPILTPSSFSLYATVAKTEYFVRELAINSTIAGAIALERNNNIRNVNTQELYSLNLKMLTKLKNTNKNVHKNAAFVIIASLLSKAANMSQSDLNKILSLGL